MRFTATESAIETGHAFAFASSRPATRSKTNVWMNSASRLMMIR